MLWHAATRAGLGGGVVEVGRGSCLECISLAIKFVGCCKQRRITTQFHILYVNLENISQAMATDHKIENITYQSDLIEESSEGQLNEML